MAVAVPRLVSRVGSAASRPVSSASVAVLRIAFGVGMLINTCLYLPVLVSQYYVDTTFHFPYGPLTFVRPLPGMGMHLVYVAMGITGVLIALGLWYRLAVVAFFVLTTYVFLVDSTFFQNHEYLISLLAFLVAVLPLHCRWSLDARRRPELRSATVPAWVVWLFRFQIGVPYFFGGVAKLNADWLQGEPLRMWLATRTDVGPLHALLTNETVVWAMAYGSLAFDLAIVGFLLHRRTRVPAFVAATGFHLMNVALWGLYIFPWLMIAATTVFFAPDWPERALVRLRTARPAPESSPTPPVPPPGRSPWPRLSPALGAFLAVWVAVQLVMPVRHVAIDGSPSWTEQGHRFAWHMKLRDKRGTVTFVVTTPERTLRIDPTPDLGWKQAARLAGHPERLAHYARHLSQLHGGAEVRAVTSVSLNGRDPQPIVDPDVDLASVPVVWWRSAPWILPLEEPLRR